MPTNGYAEQSAILGTAVTNTTSTVEFSFDPSVLYIAVGTSELLQFFVSPGTAIDGSPICESSDPEIAPPSKVATHRLANEDIYCFLYVKGHNRGTCTLTFVFNNGMSCQCTVRVMGPEEFEYSNVCIDGVYYNFDRQTLTAEVVKVPEGIEPYKGKITIPSELEWYGRKYAVTSVGEYAFASCDVSSVQLPTSLKQIKAYAFTQSNLTYVDILDAVESIGESAFKDCASLESIYLGKSVKTIGFGAFAGCTKLKQFFVSDYSTELSVNDGVIYDKDFTKLILVPCGKTSVSIPATVRSIGESSFMGNALIDNIDFPGNLETIEEYACAGCTSLKQAVIPDNVTAIEDFSFSNCPNISGIFLGSRLATIGENTFDGSRNVSEIYVYSVLPPIISETSFANYNAKLFVPIGRRGSYAKADGWKNFKNIEEFDTSGIEEVETDGRDGIMDIYNLQGILIKRNTSKTDIESLPADIYIINGKKIFLR